MYLSIDLIAVTKKGNIHTLVKSLVKLGAYFELITNAIFPSIFARQLNRSYRFHRQFRDATGQTVLTLFIWFLTRHLLHLHCQSTEICWRISTYFYYIGIHLITSRRTEDVCLSFSYDKWFFTFLKQCFKFNLFINVILVLMAWNQQKWHLVSCSNDLLALTIREPTISFV